MSLPRAFYGPLIPTGELARFRRARPGFMPGRWYAVVESPTMLGQPTRTMPDFCWLDQDGIPAHVFRAHLQIERSRTLDVG